jgi:hypothetical protein
MANQKLHSLVLLMVSFCPEIWGQTGHVAHGVGAVNQSMAGAGTALPLDATGALFWNPASVVDLKFPELDINGDVALLHGELSSSVQANILAPGIPPQSFRHFFQSWFAADYRASRQRWFFLSFETTVAALDRLPPCLREFHTGAIPKPFGTCSRYFRSIRFRNRRLRSECRSSVLRYIL